MSMWKKAHSFSKYFMYTLTGGSAMQFYTPAATSRGLIHYHKVKFSTSESVNRHSNYYWKEEHEEHLDHQASKLTHKSNAQELINALPIIEVEGDTARCTGVNEFGYGHPVEYICLNTKDPSEPNVCKW